ncbi:MAG: hypothetical protein O7C66_06275 [Alphaproteobacteria bacterium]|nr:hypothetical protein [Alphaproteobacteria bacterium]
MLNKWLSRECLVGAAITAATLVAPALASSSALAASASFPKGQKITLLISSRPGGGTNLVARLFGDALRKHLPGNPTMIYQNMGGAGGITALNRFYQTVKPDGRTFYIGAANQLNPINLSRKQIKYKPANLVLIGAFANPSSFLLLRRDAKKKLMDKSGPPVQVAAVDGLRAGSLMAVWGKDYLGWNTNLVTGYRGTKAMILSVERGETDMTGNNNLILVEPMLKRGVVDFIMQTGMLNKGKVVPSVVYPNVPIFENVVRKKMSGISLKALNVWSRQSAIGKWFALPPGTSKAIAKVYREAFVKAANDPKFKSIVTSKISPDFVEMSHSEIRGLVDFMVNAAKDPEIVKYFKKLQKKRKRRK